MVAINTAIHHIIIRDIINTLSMMLNINILRVVMINVKKPKEKSIASNSNITKKSLTHFQITLHIFCHSPSK
ncbi:MAG: hypothetical protein WCG25_06445 [bacterium]